MPASLPAFSFRSRQLSLRVPFLVSARPRSQFLPHASRSDDSGLSDRGPSGRTVASSLCCHCGFVAGAGWVLGRDADSAARNRRCGQCSISRSRAGELQLFTDVSRVAYAPRRSKGPSGVTLDVVIDRIELNGWMQPTAGGALIGVGGELRERSDSAMARRPPRRISRHASRRPTTYLDPGVGDRRAATRVARSRRSWGRSKATGSSTSARVGRRWRGGAARRAPRSGARSVKRRPHGASDRRLSCPRFSSAIAPDSRPTSIAGCRKRAHITSSRSRAATSRSSRACASFVLRVFRAGPRISALLVIVVLAAYAFVVEGGRRLAAPR